MLQVVYIIYLFQIRVPGGKNVHLVFASLCFQDRRIFFLSKLLFKRLWHPCGKIQFVKLLPPPSVHSELEIEKQCKSNLGYQSLSCLGYYSSANLDFCAVSKIIDHCCATSSIFSTLLASPIVLVSQLLSVPYHLHYFLLWILDFGWLGIYVCSEHIIKAGYYGS